MKEYPVTAHHKIVPNKMNRILKRLPNIAEFHYKFELLKCFSLDDGAILALVKDKDGVHGILLDENQAGFVVIGYLTTKGFPSWQAAANAISQKFNIYEIENTEVDNADNRIN